MGSEESRAVVGEDRELFLYASNATLEVQLTAGEAVLVRGASGSVEGTLHLQGARGTLSLAQEQVVSGQDVLFMGHLDATLRAASDDLGVGVTGTAAFEAYLAWLEVFLAAAQSPA